MDGSTKKTLESKISTVFPFKSKKKRKKKRIFSKLSLKDQGMWRHLKALPQPTREQIVSSWLEEPFVETQVADNGPKYEDHLLCLHKLFFPPNLQLKFYDQKLLRHDEGLSNVDAWLKKLILRVHGQRRRRR